MPRSWVARAVDNGSSSMSATAIDSTATLIAAA